MERNEQELKNEQVNPEEKGVLDGSYYDKQPDFLNKGTSKWRKQWDQGKVYFLVIAAGILFYFILLRFTNLSGTVSKIIGVLQPIIYGAVIAYLLNPMVKAVEKYLNPLIAKKVRSAKKTAKIGRVVGIVLAYVVMIALVVGIFNMIIPELFTSIRNMIFTLPNQLNDLLIEISEFEWDDSATGVFVMNTLTQATEQIQNWLKTDLLKQTNIIMTGLTEGVINILSTVFNVLIGAIVSFYLLFSREVFIAQSKKITYALLKPDRANMALHLAKKSNEIFGGFIIGKIIDSAIIGVLCFIGLWFLKMPYIMLISVVVGVTNVIPFFGPYIGAVPSAILILLVDPMKGLYFIIFIILLQQLDGNVIGPKILGNSTGLSSFWVIFSILVGGGLFGFVGMIIGVPTFAVIYYIVQTVINQKLEKKKLPIHSRYYDVKSYVDSDGEYVKSGDEEEKEDNKKN